MGDRLTRVDEGRRGETVRRAAELRQFRDERRRLEATPDAGSSAARRRVARPSPVRRNSLRDLARAQSLPSLAPARSTPGPRGPRHEIRSLTPARSALGRMPRHRPPHPLRRNERRPTRARTDKVSPSLASPSYAKGEQRKAEPRKAEKQESGKP